MISVRKCRVDSRTNHRTFSYQDRTSHIGRHAGGSHLSHRSALATASAPTPTERRYCTSFGLSSSLADDGGTRIFLFFRMTGNEEPQTPRC